MIELVRGARRVRWINVAVVILRILIAFAFVPAALKKVLDQPFTDPANHGTFHDFLHAFHATGWFYTFVGVMQLVAAALLFTQRFALIGALIALPMLSAISVFCWSTGVVVTSVVATLMWLGTIGLIGWDVDKWKGVLARDGETVTSEPTSLPIDLRLWAKCGWAILILYIGTALLRGGVYRPRGLELGEPAFYVLPVVMLLPIVTLVIEQRRRAAASR
ncbi:MAG: hypothetical protein H0V17_07430 [Deltaproteobacteria bacterium]|nr:hypothetical protein [Deltaproteobacteria bacterium]